MNTLKTVCVGVLLLSTSVVIAQENAEQKVMEKEPSEIILEHWAYYIQEPMKYFRLARKHLDAKEHKLAATALRQANVYLILEYYKSTGDRERLKKVINDLNNLVKKLESNRDVSEEAYDAVLILANLRLVQHYYYEAASALENNRMKRVGLALNASIDHFDRVGELSDIELAAESIQILDQSQALSQQLIEGKSVEKKEINSKLKSFRGMANELEIKTDPELRIEKKF